jgi:hypothetical protein
MKTGERPKKDVGFFRLKPLQKNSRRRSHRIAGNNDEFKEKKAEIKQHGLWFSTLHPPASYSLSPTSTWENKQEKKNTYVQPSQ